MDLVRVIAGCTHRAGLLAMYEQQLGAAGIPLKLEINESLNYPNGLRMIGDHVRNLRRWLDKYGDCKNVIFSDAWDVLFYGSAEDVAKKVPESGVLLAAEKNCFPDAYLKESYRGETSWRFVNGGLLAAKPENLDRWLDEVESHPAYHPAIMDQQWMNHRLLEQQASELVRGALMPIDSKCELFYCRFLESGEMQFMEGMPFNSVCNTFPNFIHFNGKSPVETFLMMRYATR